MGRRETVIYECDWCKTESPAYYPNGRSGDDEWPVGWSEVEYALLCVACQGTRKSATEDARSACLNKWPWPLVPTDGSWVGVWVGNTEPRTPRDGVLVALFKNADYAETWAGAPGLYRGRYLVAPWTGLPLQPKGEE